MIVLFLALLIGGIYVLIIGAALYGWSKTSVWTPPADWLVCTKVSVIVPARNEAENIAACLDSLLAQNFPKENLEIIAVDDFSDDNTAEIIGRYAGQVRLLKMSDRVSEQHLSSKKTALTYAVEAAKGTLIVTTDADTSMPSDWLRLLVSFYEKTGAKMIAAPVLFHEEKSIFEKFQSLDYAGMMGVTAAGFYFKKPGLCNGANLAFEKTAFEAVGGYAGTDHLASGDDMLLLEKIHRRFRGKTAFLKNADAAVFTHAKSNLAGFWRQRVRWASKSGAYTNPLTQFLQAWVFLTSWAVIGSFFAALFWSSEVGWTNFRILFFSKTFADFLLLKKTTTFFKKKDLMAAFPAAFFLHTFYVALVGLASFFQKKYEWKGRRLR